jgi:acetyl/propionyl-CoA carboxylase alpha subunit/acetyl-CoA carboxylase carboxyltransferase component
MKRLLIANRGEIAVRVLRTASDLGIATVAVFAEDDAEAPHVRMADQAISLQGAGPAAYLDIEALVAHARSADCDALHPGYGFLSENADFARACHAAGVAFVGPDAETLALFGDKAAARRLARDCGLATPPGTDGATSLAEAQAFLSGLGPGGAIMLKAVSGGGGRGMAPVTSAADLPDAFDRCVREARQAFGSGDLYAEALIARARHVEVQIVGDGREVRHLWDRECSLQRQRQKLIEIAPAVGLADDLRDRMLAAAERLAAAANYRGLGTIEFLVDAGDAEGGFVFIEANPRLQVEHTVTEAVLGLDLVALQLRLASGARLADVGLGSRRVPAPRGVALQARINMETLGPDGTPRPTGGVIAAYRPPTGPGVRADGWGVEGLAPSLRYDSLLAKVVAHGEDLDQARRRALRALSEFRIEGVATNRALLSALLDQPVWTDPAQLHTCYVEANLAALLDAANTAGADPSGAADRHRAGARVDPEDPLAVLSVRPDRSRTAGPGAAAAPHGPPGTEPARAPIQGVVVQIAVSPGQTVRRNQTLGLMEALKMEHPVHAPVSGIVRAIAVDIGDAVLEGAPFLFLEPAEVEGDKAVDEEVLDPDAIRPDLARINRLRARTTDAARAEAVAKRHAQGKRTARENIADLCDADSFLEYGQMVTAARRMDETDEELGARLARTPADGIVTGIGRVNGAAFGPERSCCAVLSYDYTVLAGTQGSKNHVKTDRMLEVAQRYGLPVVFFTEGGGGRMGGTSPGDPPPPPTTTGALKVGTWRVLGQLSGKVPVVGVTTGRCFAGNAVVLALCDVIIATRDSTIGVGGPAMIEGGGLGVYAPEEVGPVSIQAPNGVIDLLVEDEAEAVAAARRYLGYFQGRTDQWEAPDQRRLRHLVPENRRAVYDVRQAISTLADAHSVLELRADFGVAMVTAFARIEGRPVGVIANNNHSPTGGAVDADAADKAARFMQLCDAFDIPLVTLIDVPGNMVGPDSEATAALRHCGRLYVTGANLSVPHFSVVLRKAYGLGALAMSGGSIDAPFFTVAWPTGEFAGMGIEGSVKLGRRAELQAITDIKARRARYEELVGRAYDWASALNGATVFEIDDVIDPADTRRWLVMGLEAAAGGRKGGKKRPFVDTW